MNPLLSRLQAYPFERLRQLFADVTPNPAYSHISLGMGDLHDPGMEYFNVLLETTNGRHRICDLRFVICDLRISESQFASFGGLRKSQM